MPDVLRSKMAAGNRREMLCEYAKSQCNGHTSLLTHWIRLEPGKWRSYCEGVAGGIKQDRNAVVIVISVSHLVCVVVHVLGLHFII